MAIVGDGAQCRWLQVAVGFVDDDEIGELDDALLDPLQIIAAAGRQQQQEDVDHVGDRGLRLANADGLDDHHIETRGFDEEDRLARPPGHAA